MPLPSPHKPEHLNKKRSRLTLSILTLNVDMGAGFQVDPPPPQLQSCPTSHWRATAIVTENTAKRVALVVPFPLGFGKPVFQGCLSLESNPASEHF